VNTKWYVRQSAILVAAAITFGLLVGLLAATDKGVAIGYPAPTPVRVVPTLHVPRGTFWVYLPFVMKSLGPQLNITAQALAERSFALGTVVGMKADVWTAQQPSNWYAIGSPVGVCTTNAPCNGPYFETGYVRGLRSFPANSLQQYVSYLDTASHVHARYDLGLLNDNSWYTFQVLNTPPYYNWQAYLNGASIYTNESYPGFGVATSTACGAEGGDLGVPLGVQCDNMQYEPAGYTGWTLFVWNTKGFIPGTLNYCVDTISDPYGAIGWGPC
jgi:hypothetical protein